MKLNKHLLTPDSQIALPPPPTPEGVVVNNGQSANLAQAAQAEAPVVNAPPALSTTEHEVTDADFNNVLEGRQSKVVLPPKPVVEPTVEPVVKPAEVKPTLEVKPVDSKLPAITLKQPAKVDPATQPEYAGLNDDEVRIFKAMSNDAKKMLRPIYDEHKTQKATIKDLESKLATAPKLVDGVPLNYMEHQEAYTLTPNYKAAIKQHQLAAFENEHWGKQLANIEAGKPAKTLSYNPDTGKYSYGEDLAPTPETKAAIIGQMNSTQQWKMSVAQQANQIAANHGAEYQKAVQFAKKVEDDFFPFFAKDDHEYVPLIKQVVGSLPEVYRNHPLATIIGKSYAVVTELQKQLNDANAKLASGGNGSQPSDAAKAGPNSQQTNSAVAAPVRSGEPTDDELDKMFTNLTKRH